MYTAAPYPSKYPNSSQPSCYNGESYSSSYSPPQPVLGVATSNLQTLKKYSNLQSLQNLNVSNDSPRASYSSSSSTSTGSSSSNLVIPEIFKQDSKNNYPSSAPNLPPKPREQTQVNTHSYSGSPQGNFYPAQNHQYPQASFYASNLIAANNSLNSISNSTQNSLGIPSVEGNNNSYSPNNNNGKSFHDNSINQKLTPSNQSKPPPLILTSPTNHQNYGPPYSPTKPQPPVPQSMFSSYPETSSFTCYSSSCSVPNQSSMSHLSTSYIRQQQANGQPDLRRLSDPNSRKILPEFPVAHQRVSNEYPQQIVGNKYIPDRPGDQRQANHPVNCPSTGQGMTVKKQDQQKHGPKEDCPEDQIPNKLNNTKFIHPSKLSNNQQNIKNNNLKNTNNKDIAQQKETQQQVKKPVRSEPLSDKQSSSQIKSSPQEDLSQTRSQQSRENLAVQRDRLSGGVPCFVRSEAYQNKVHDYHSKSHEYLNQVDYLFDQSKERTKQTEFTSKPLDYQSKSQEFLNKDTPECPSISKSQEYHRKSPDFKSPTSVARTNMSNSPLKGTITVRERVTSPHRGVTSPISKVQGRIQSPPSKILDSRYDHSRHDKVGSPVNSNKIDTQPSLSSNHKNGDHFIQQYPEKDNSKSQAPVWEAGYLLEKYSGGPYSPLPPIHPAAKSEKAIDDPEFAGSYFKEQSGSYPIHKHAVMKDAISNSTDSSKISRVAAKLVPVRVIPEQSDIYGTSTQHEHISHSACPDTTTDCGSLSKSSSDGDHNIMNRKRPPTKLKSKRRNILSFPHHLSVDELRVIQRREESYGAGAGSSSDDNRSSGHASMSDGHTSSSPPLDTLPRHHDHIIRGSALKSVPEDERLSAGVTAISKPPTGGNAALRRGMGGQAYHKFSGGRFRGGLGGSHTSQLKDDMTLEAASGLEDIKLAIEQLTMRSQGSRTSYSTSTYSSMSGSESEPARRLVRHSSLETVNTNVTAADEFVWVDSHDRLVELQQLPWSNHDVLRVIQNGRVKEQLDRVSIEAVPRLSYLLQRALVRVAREAQRLTRPLAMCSKQEVSSAFKVVLSPALADSCIKSCLRAAAMYTVSGDNLRQAKAARAGLNLSTGRFMRWMCDVRVGKFIHEYAAVYLTAGLENLLEEMVLQCLPPEKDQMLTATLLEHSIANNADLWGLLQPYAHLNAGRTATGALCLPRWASTTSIEKSGGSAGQSASGDATASTTTITDSGHHSGGSSANDSSNQTTSRCSSSLTLTPDEHSRAGKTLEQSLLTTCVGSLAELSDLLTRVSTHHQQSMRSTTPSSSSLPSTSSQVTVTKQISSSSTPSTPTVILTPSSAFLSPSTFPPISSSPSKSSGSYCSSSSGAKALITWGPSALHALFYFMRCSQLEHAEHASRAPIQELVYERPYIVLPPLVEWVRVATAHTEHRHSTVVDKDDVMQAARLLLPGVDCPVRMIGYEELMCPRRQLDEAECAKKFKVDLAFKMLSCGRTDLVPHALQLLPTTKVNTVNEYGLTPLMLACIRGDETLVHLLLDSKADVDAETPPTGPSYLMANPETQHWTALTYAAIHGHLNLAQTLLLRGANVEGGATLAEEKCTETPLQVAVAAGHTELVGLLLSCGANPYLCTLMKDSLCYSGAAQRGCYAAVAVAAAHGQRNLLHRLLAHPTQQSKSAREVLSLEEILAEGASGSGGETDKKNNSSSSSNSEGTLLPSASLGLVDGRSTVTSTGSDLSQGLKLSKQQVKTLQEAMYHSAESGHLDMTLDLRNLGVPWTLHCWMHTLATAQEHRLETIIDQLLQDFLQVWPDDYSAQFVDECLPLLFTIFRHSKNEGTTLLLADIFSSCYGKEAIKEVVDTSESSGAQIDTNFVNNPELSDVQFRVEGKIFYAHKIILVNASLKFKELLSSKYSEGNPHVIYDIRYEIFELVMQSLYLGGCKNLQVDDGDVLELMLAADFFRLESLLKYCEARCSTLVHLHNVVTMYIHAKVYGALQLVEYCQGFLLQNMVALLTYDDSVRRLIFGKKYQHHDVLNGLLSTLQNRIRSRAYPRAGKN